MARNILVTSSAPAVDEVARIEATSARTEAGTALTALSGAAHDEVARTMVSTLLASGQRHPWFSDAALAAGVDRSGGGYLGSVLSLAPAALPLSHQYAANVQYNAGRFNLTVTGATLGNAEAVDIDLVPISAETTYGMLVTNFADCPALTAGEYIWVVYPVSWLSRTGNEEIAFEAISNNAVLHPTSSSRTASVKITDTGVVSIAFWSTTAGNLGARLIRPDGAENIEIVDVDGGKEVRLRYLVAPGASIAAGELAFCVRQHIEYNKPFRAAPARLYANAHPDAANVYYTVDDPAGTGHRTTLPAVLEITASKPMLPGTIMEVSGDTGSGAGLFVTRVAVLESGALQLQVSENGGSAPPLTATLPTTAWGLTENRLSLRITGEEVVLFVNGYAATGLPLTSVPTGIAGYAIGARADGSAAAGLVPTVAADAAAVDGLAADTYRLMLAAEMTALPVELPGRVYAEHG